MDLEELLYTLLLSQLTMIVDDFSAHLADAENSSVPNHKVWHSLTGITSMWLPWIKTLLTLATHTVVKS